MSSLTPSYLLLLCLLFLGTRCQVVTIKNLGCKAYSAANICIQCSTRYYLDGEAICQPVNPNCKTYNPTNGACTSCYPGFGIIEDTCLPGVSNSFDPNCNTFDGQLCAKCSVGYFLSNTAKCLAVNPACKTYDQGNGLCTSCFSGYAVENGNCVLSTVQPTIANCNSIDPLTNLCLKCSNGYVFNSQGVCVQLDPNCKSFKEGSNVCLSCYSGYSLNNNQCLKQAAAQIDPNCRTFSGTVCTECAKGAIFNPSGICIIVDPSCYTFNDSDGSCLTCYPGYAVQGKTCLRANATEVSDPYCKSFLAPDVCEHCSERYYLNGWGKCQEVNPLCKTYQSSTGHCLTCYPGFVLVGTTCLASVDNITDQNCKTWSGSVCKECAFGAFFLANGTCAVANPLCRTFDPSNGLCLSCYDSFELSFGGCVKSTQTLSDPNCAEFYQNICLKCSAGFFFLDNGQCGGANPNCKQFNSQTGQCLGCYMGYALNNGVCVNSTIDPSAIDPNCASFVNNICSKCSKNFFFGSNKLCIAVNPLCNGYDDISGICLGCYQSFVLINGNCIEDRNNSLTDPNCANWLQGVCLSCSPRTFMNNMGLCQDISTSCNTYNANTGQCTSCFPGFQIWQGKCQQALSPDSCSKLNPDGSCALCGPGSYLSQGKCIAIDTQCANFSLSTQSCLACYPGYSILNGACQVSKVDSQFEVENCYAYDQHNNCIKCYDRFFLSQNSCKTVDVFCKTYDDHNGNCLTCYTSFILANGKCTK